MSLWSWSVCASIKFLGGRIQKSSQGISYIELGQREHPSLVFLHGFGDVKESALRSANYLKRYFHIILPDLPSFGDSSDLSKPHNLDNYAQDLQRFFIDLKLKNYVLAGNSMGGAITAKMAQQYPQELRAAIIVNGAGIVLKEHYSLAHEYLEGKELFNIQSERDFDYMLGRIFHRRPYMPRFVKRAFLKRYLEENEKNKMIFEELVSNGSGIRPQGLEELESIEAWLGQIQIPTLILWGEKDSLFPIPSAHIYHQKIDDSQLRILNNIGHSPQIENPRLFSQAILEFTRTLA